MSRLLESLAQSNAPAPALRSGGRRLGRGELLDAAERLARALANDPSPVAVCLPNGPSWLQADLALGIAGRPCVPVPPWFGPAQLAHLAESVGLGAVIGTRPPSIPHGRGRRLGPGLGCWPLESGPVALPEGTAKITFTSGTTGAPKGVCLARETLESVAGSLAELGRELGIRRHLCVLPLAVLLENVGGAWAALLAEAECIVPPLRTLGLDGATGVDARRLMAGISALEPGSLILVPALLEAIVGALEQGAPRPRSLRFVAVGGAPTPVALLERAERLGLPVYQGYGLSECASVVALNRPGDNLPGTVGRPLPHVRIELAADGEIFIDGPMLLGYAGDPAPPPRPWPTGDLGRLDADGRLAVVGRKRNVFITSMGRNLSPEWLESELAATESIRQAVVFGEGLPAPVAVVAARRSDAHRVGASIEALNRRLPGHARIARWVLAGDDFGLADGLCTPNGRPVRSAVWARYARALLRNEATITRKIDGDEMSEFFAQLGMATETERQHLLQSPIIQAALRGEVSREQYLAFLAQAFHHVRHTVPLLMACGARLPARLEWLRKAVIDYLNEEYGHEQWILTDICAAGGDPQSASSQPPLPATAAMVSCAWDQVQRGNPAGFFGMVFVLEGTSIALATRAADTLRARLGLPAEAFRYLYSHGSLDEEHVAFLRSLLNRLEDEEDREAVVDAARRFYLLYAAIFRSLPQDAGARRAVA
jgi:acyl-CoA synthetase (AMP-forming)/AMP-acid ligase II